jgi:hypothetical protein
MLKTLEYGVVQDLNMGMLDTVFVKGKDFLTRNIAGETLIIPLRGRVGDLDALFTLNEVGVRVWGLIDGKANVGQIAQAISEEYDVSEEAATSDVSELLTTMADAGLIAAAGR